MYIQNFRKITLLVFTVLTLTVLSCSKQDDIGSNTSPIFGKWKFVFRSTSYNQPCELEGYLQFNSGGTMIDYDACNNKTSMGTYVYKDNQLTTYLDVFPFTLTWTITKLTATELEMKNIFLGSTTINRFKKV